MEIRNHGFLITGGASGLGAATARVLTRQGGKVIIADRDAAAGARLETELAGAGHFIETDVTREDSVHAALKAASKTSENLRGVINCAGIGSPEKVVSDEGPHSLARFEQVIRVNLIGTFNVTRLAAALMARLDPLISGERGVIVNTASVAAFEGQIGQASYAASKGGIVSMTLPIARELAKHGIRVMAIAPGIFDTPMLAGLKEEVRQSLGQQVPFPPRLGRPDEFGALVKHIIENEMLNGAVIRLDGAIRMAAR